MSFINRRDELNLLKERIASNKAEFIIIYGRRRVGKSELINELLKHSYGIKLLAREEAEEMQLRRFSENLSLIVKDEVLQKNPLRTWDSFFTYLGTYSQKRIIIALDEFPYVVSENKSIPSIIQDYWDNKLKETKICLILCGSSISMMEKILGHKSPLYGRRTSQLLIRPFTFKQAREYLKIPFEDAIRAYAIFGGTPAYLLEYALEKNLKQNVQDSILKKDSFLCRDVEFVLKEELREPRYYFSLLSSIAKGNTKVSAIMNDTGINKSITGKYISILSELMLIKREIPIFENPLKSRSGIYKLDDNFFKFWFKFIYPYKEDIERGNYNSILKAIDRDLNSYISSIFENICKEALENSSICKDFKIGRWWHKDKEIDLIAFSEDKKEIYFCECKWQDKVNARRIWEELKEKTNYVDWKREERQEKYYIFAKSFKEKIKDSHLQLFDLKDLEKIFS